MGTDWFYFNSRCSYGYNGIPVKFYPDKKPYYRECNGDSTVGYEEGCVYLTLEDGHTASGSIMFGRQYHDQVNHIVRTATKCKRTNILLIIILSTNFNNYVYMA